MSASKDVVVGIDSSTTSTKAIAWRCDGSMAGIGRSPIPLARPGIGLFEQNPEDWWSAAASALHDLLQQVSRERVAAVAIANQRETFVPLDEKGHPVRPAIIWLDQRCRNEVAWLSGRVGAESIHRITGKPPDVAPVAYRIAWMLRNEPELFRRCAMFADVHGYLVWRLTGSFATSWASADPLGLFDMEERTWSQEVLQALELRPDQLPRLTAPGTVLGTTNAAAAARTGLAEGTPVVAGGGDGQAAGLGVNALTPGRAYLNLGTAAVSGTFSKTYRTGMAWRTMSDCSGEGYYYETSLRAGTFLIEWFVRQVCEADERDQNIYQRLEAEATRVPAGSRGLITLPYWGAVMTPYWDPHARGCLVGFTGSHQIGEMYRSLLEGIALEQALVSGIIEQQTGAPIKEFVTIGGGAASTLWCQIMADVCGKTIRRPRTVEASSLGAAMCGATGVGWFNSPCEAAAAMAGEIVHENEPDPKQHGRYTELMTIYREVYPQVRELLQRLSHFTASDPEASD